MRKQEQETNESKREAIVPEEKKKFDRVLFTYVVLQSIEDGAVLHYQQKMMRSTMINRKKRKKRKKTAFSHLLENVSPCIK